MGHENAFWPSSSPSLPAPPLPPLFISISSSVVIPRLGLSRAESLAVEEAPGDASRCFLRCFLCIWCFGDEVDGTTDAAAEAPFFEGTE